MRYSVLPWAKKSGELVWLKNPGKDALSGAPWQEHALGQGPDFLFCVKPTGSFGLVAPEFISGKARVVRLVGLPKRWNSSSGRCFMRNRGQTGALGSIVDMLPCPVDLMNHQSHPPATTTRVQTMYGGRWSVYIDVYIIYRYNTRYIGIRYTYIRLYKHEDGHVHVPCPSSGQVVYWYMDGHKMRSRVLDDTTGPGFSCSWADLNNAPRHDRYLMTPFCCVST